MWAVTVVLCVCGVLSFSCCCPRSCSCSDKSSRHFVDCTFRELSVIPPYLPSNASTISLSANRIASVSSRSFSSSRYVTSLWMTQNAIFHIENGSFSGLVFLRNLDLSHNNLVNFPWSDLQNLTLLQLLRLEHNKLEHLPQNAFVNLRELNSLRLNNNRFLTVFKGTFDGLPLLSYVQLYSNPFVCNCFLYWLKHWILNSKINIKDPSLILCAAPEKVRGEMLLNLPDSNCVSPSVKIHIDNDQNERFSEGGLLILTCEYSGNPRPTVQWRINSNKELAMKLTENDSAEILDNSLKVYDNGTLIVSNLKKEDSGVYSCFAVNEAGLDERSVAVEVLADGELTTANYAKATQSATKTTHSVTDSSSQKAVESQTKAYEKSASKCSLSPETKYVTGFVSNASFDDVQQYSFDFGVVALAVTETEVVIRLKTLTQETRKENEENDLNGMFLCLSSSPNAQQWTQIKDGISTYYFADLRQSENYSLCLTVRGEDCSVQVYFKTRKSIPDLIIIISVSICLLTVATVPLMAATCYHLVYEYRSQMYRMYLKARGKCRVQGASFRTQGDQSKAEEEEVTDAGEKDTEESILADTPSVDKLTSECEVESEYSDRLPLGAEADNITE